MIVTCKLGAGISDPFVRGLLEGFAAHDELWFRTELARGRFVPSPLALAYVPDEISAVVVLRDACDLARRGRGSCLELACAYAGWFRAHDQPARLVSSRESREVWHAYIATGDRIVDPKGAPHGKAA